MERRSRTLSSPESSNGQPTFDQASVWHVSRSAVILVALPLYDLLAGVDGVVTPRCTIGIQAFDFFVTDWRTGLLSFYCAVAPCRLHAG